MSWLTSPRLRAVIWRSFTPTPNLHGYPPAESEIAAAMCVSPPSVNQMVKMLEKKGLILRQPGQPRSIQVLVPEDEIPPWNNRKPAKNPAPGQPTQAARCSGPGGASGELVRRVGLLAEWAYQSELVFCKVVAAGVKIGKTAPFSLGLALAQLDCGAYR